MAKPKKASGQITLRCPPEMHAELLEIAVTLGVDLNGLLNMMLKQALPDFRDRAAKAAEVLLRSEHVMAEGVAIPTEEPVVRQMVLAARRVPAEARLETLREVAQRFGSPEDPPVQETVLFALQLMEKAAALHQLRSMRTKKRRWPFGDAERGLLEQMETRLGQEIEELKGERERAREQKRR